MTNKRLTKSNQKVLSGVIGGFANYINFDATILRLLYVLITLFTGFFPLVIFYIIAAVIMPSEPHKTSQYQFKEDDRKDVTPDDNDF